MTEPALETQLPVTAEVTNKQDGSKLMAQLEAVSDQISDAKGAISRIIFGQDCVIEEIFQLGDNVLIRTLVHEKALQRPSLVKRNRQNREKIMAKQPTQTRVRRREKKNIATGVAHVNSTFNNTMITISDVQGNTIAWSSAGTMGFKGSRKSTPFAAQMAAEDAGKKAAEHGVKSVDVEVRGPGSGRESALRALQTVGFTVNSIRDVTPIPHNGCRPRKRRRV